MTPMIEGWSSFSSLRQVSISRLENPNYRHYSLRTLEKVARALNARLRVELEEKRKAP